MVDVTEHRDDRRARLEQCLVVVLVVVVEERDELDLLFAAGLDDEHLRAERLGDQLDHLVGERRGRGHHLAGIEQQAHEVGRTPVQPRRVVLDRDAARDDDLAFGNWRVVRRERELLLQLALVEIATPLASLRRPPAATTWTTTPTTGTTAPGTGTAGAWSA